MGDGLWTTLLELGAPAVTKELQTLVQGEGFDAAVGTILRAGVKGLKCKASHSAKPAIQKVTKQNGWLQLVMKPHLGAFHSGSVLVLGIDIKLCITFNSADFFCFAQR